MTGEPLREIGHDVEHYLLRFLSPRDYVVYTSCSKRMLALRTQESHAQNTMVDTCKLLHQVFDRRANVLMHGPGGCGKTHALGILRKRAISLGLNIAMTATTGIGACGIPGGVTVHSFSGLGKGTIPLAELERQVNENPAKAVSRFRQWRNLHILVIDEISMMGTRFFRLLNYITQHVRQDTRPMGGVQLVLCGDFLQLPPVGDTFLFTQPEWTSLNLVTVPFSTPYRQLQDAWFFGMLQRVRYGQPSAVDMERIAARCIDKVPDFVYTNVGKELVPPFMFSRHNQVDKLNQERFDSIAGPTEVVHAIDSFYSITRVRNDATGRMERVKTALPPQIVPAHVMARIQHKQPDTVVLKENAQYIITQNMHAPKLTNGTMGLLQRHQNPPSWSLCLKNGKVVQVEGMRQTISYCINPQQQHYIQRYQYVLRLGYAITIHSAQGMTLDWAVVDSGKSIFAAAQTYVAWSRVRRLEDLILLDFDAKSIKVHDQARKYVAKLEGVELRDEEHVKPAAKRRKQATLPDMVKRRRVKAL